MSEGVDNRYPSVYSGGTDKAPECSCPCMSRPARQRIANINTFVAIMSAYILFFVSIDMYLMAVITTIEKRFGFSSHQSGMLLSAKEITFFCTVSFLSHFAKKSHRPRLIGLMGFIGALAGYVMALPQMMFGNVYEHTDGSTGGPGDDPKLCIAASEVNNSSSSSEICDSTHGHFQIGAYSVFVFGAILIGLCQSCQGALSATYLDDSTTRDKMAFYLGIISAMRPFGPMLSFLLGGIFTSIPQDFTYPGYDNADPRWVGAWWLGYIVCPTLFLIPCTLLLFFPKNLSRPKEIISTLETEKMTVPAAESIKPEGFKGFIESLRRLLSNPVYMLFLVASCLGGFVVSGMFPFLPKYLETQFAMTATKANVLIGSMASTMAGLGVFLGGVIQSRCKWKPHNSSLYIFCVFFIFFTVIGSLMFVGCDQTPMEQGIEGWTHADNNGTAAYLCDCQEEYYPVCGSNQRTYRSPCHAGCTTFNKTYSGCSWIQDGGLANQGACRTSCMWDIAYILLLSFVAFVSMTGGVPGYVLIMRSVDETDKSLALGFLGMAASIVSFVPGPIAYGALVDGTCLLWRQSCGAEGSCLLYDATKFRYRLHGVTSVLIGAADVIFGVVTVILWKMYKREQRARVNVTELSSPEGLAIKPI